MKLFHQASIFILLVLVSMSASAWLASPEDQSSLNEKTAQELYQQAIDQPKDIKEDLLWKPDPEAIKAQEQYLKKAQSRWGLFEVSPNQLQWFEDDFSTKTLIHYEANTITVSMPRIKNTRGDFDIRLERKLVKKTLKKIVSMKNKELLELLKEQYLLSLDDIEKILKKGLASEYVFQELFSENDAVQKDRVQQEQVIQTIVSQMMRSLNVEFYHQKSPNTSKSSILARSSTSTAALSKEPLVEYTVDLPEERLLKSARLYYKDIVSAAQKRDVPPSLILAIIHTESHFNPLARSHIPAYGLMQIVPATAGADVVNFYYPDLKHALSPSYLFDPKNNIEFGVAYLNILYTRYLRGLTNEQSRGYYTVGAYNAGASSIARVFASSGKISDAVGIVNDLSPEDVKHSILKNAPSSETRNYLKKVVELERFYKQKIEHW